MRRWLGRSRVDREAWLAVLRRDPCAYCGRRVKLIATLDHIVPRARGGTDSMENLVGTCEGCNQRKGAMSLLGYLLSNRKFGARG